MDANPFEKYRNPDPRCVYPFTPGNLGYCWSYAHHVDGTDGFKNTDNFCPGCEFWEPGESESEAK